MSVDSLYESENSNSNSSSMSRENAESTSLENSSSKFIIRIRTHNFLPGVSRLLVYGSPENPMHF